MLVQLNPTAVKRMRRAGKVAAATLAATTAQVRPGITTAALDHFVRRDTRRRGARPSQLGHHGFPAAVCTSVNEVVCHGIPSPKVRLKDGDIINIDVTSHIGGYHGDTSRTVFVGAPSAEARHVVEVAQRCLKAGIAAVKPGVHLGVVGHVIETLAKAEGCSVVEAYGGHGIGRKMHLPPTVNHTGPADAGPILVPGFAFTIEPMINLGGPEVVDADDGWTVLTADGSLSAQFEHTVLVTEAGVEVLTAR